MDDQTVIDLDYGGEKLSFHIPTAWLGQVIGSPETSAVSDEAALIREALGQPIGCPPLRDQAEPGMKVAIIFDDGTRKTPVRLMVPPILEELDESGVSAHDITFVAALGTHRPMDQGELVAKLGPDIVRRYRIVNSPADDEESFVYLGEAGNGLPAHVKKPVVEADLRIGVGQITPHTEAGYGGGCKIILPGVCNRETVTKFHHHGLSVEANVLATDDAVIRKVLEDFVQDKVPLHYIVNAVIALDGSLVACVAGHQIEAFREGTKHCDRAYGATVTRRYPVVVSNAYPYDIDWWQGTKGIYSGDKILEPGGTLVLLAYAREGHGIYRAYPGYCGEDPRALKARIEAGAIPPAELNEAIAAVVVGYRLANWDFSVVSHGLKRPEVEITGARYFETLEDAVAHAVDKLPEEQRGNSVAVLTHGGQTIPRTATPR